MNKVGNSRKMEIVDNSKEIHVGGSVSEDERQLEGIVREAIHVEHVDKA